MGGGAIAAGAMGGAEAGWCGDTSQGSGDRARSVRFAERGEKIIGASEAGVAIFGASSLHHIVDGARHIRAKCGDAGHRRLGVHAHELVVAGASNGHSADEKLDRADAQRVDVDALVEIALASHLLRSHVRERADDALVTPRPALASSSPLAMPKSVTFATPSFLRMRTLAGLRSRWISPSAWAAPDAEQDHAKIGRTSLERNGRSRRRRAVRSSCRGARRR